MNMNQLYYFSELAKQHQFSRAAKRLNISQPSLSNSIKSLEKELNCNLIEHRNGRIELTKYGQIFLESTNSIISILEKTMRIIDQTKRIENSTVVIGCIPTAAEGFLPHVISAFQKENSVITHYISHSAISEHICLELQNENYDIGICTKIEKYPVLKFIPLYIENTIFTNTRLTAELELPKHTRTIYLAYNCKAHLSESAQNLINFITK